MKSIIKHFEFKSSGGKVVSIDAASMEGKPVFLAVDLATTLGYADPHNALSKHCKSLIRLNSVESAELGFGVRPRGVILAGQSDMFRLIMRSSLPSAERLQDWVCEEVLPALMEAGTYSIHKAKSSSGSGLPEYRRAKADQLKAVALEKNISSAKELMSMLPRLGDAANQVIVATLVNPLLGHEVVPPPLLEERFYTAAQAGEQLGVSANKIGRLANKHSLKTEMYGEFFLDKSKYSNKQVEAFRYNANGVGALRHLIHGADVA